MGRESDETVPHHSGSDDILNETKGLGVSRGERVRDERNNY